MTLSFPPHLPLRPHSLQPSTHAVHGSWLRIRLINEHSLFKVAEAVRRYSMVTAEVAHIRSTFSLMLSIDSPGGNVFGPPSLFRMLRADRPTPKRGKRARRAAFYARQRAMRGAR